MVVRQSAVRPSEQRRQTVRWAASVLLSTAALLSAVALADGGHGGTGTASGSRIEAGSYRAILRLPGGDLPFELDLVHEGGAWSGYLVNGQERVRLNEVAVDGPHLDIKMPGYENRLRAERTGEGVAGELVLDKLGGKDQHIPLRAELRQNYRFFPEDTQPHGKVADLSGRWAVTFADEDGTTEPAVGEFTQTGDTVNGTFLTDTGDHRFLAGQVRGNELYLSTFDGAHAFLYKASLSAADGVLTGDFWSGSVHHERWTARRDPQAALPDAYSLTRLRPGVTRFDFTFPDLAGHPVSSADPRFRDKVVVVALAGSWCPNCHDEAAFLAPLYREYRARGLEVVSLMFEHFGDFERAAAATGRFKQHYGIDYTTLIAGISDKDDAGTKLPMLTRVYAFPTTLFIDRKGRVRKIHTGFTGPATGAHYTQFVDEFRRTIDQLLAES